MLFNICHVLQRDELKLWTDMSPIFRWYLEWPLLLLSNADVAKDLLNYCLNEAMDCIGGNELSLNPRREALFRCTTCWPQNVHSVLQRTSPDVALFDNLYRYSFVTRESQCDVQSSVMLGLRKCGFKDYLFGYSLGGGHGKDVHSLNISNTLKTLLGFP